MSPKPQPIYFNKMTSSHSCITFLTLSIILILPLFLPSTHANFAMEEHSEIEAIIPTLRKLTRLHFYFHDVVGGKHPTAVRIAGPKNAFTTTAIVDDPLTEGPDPKSRIIGRAQGLYAIASNDSSSLLMAINLAFTEGKYNGSTLSIFGRNPFLEAEREMPIVGGSGLFRFARGYALAKTVKYVPSTGDAIVEYNVFVQHS